MELFSLLAKLTLDSKEYDKGLQDAENKAQGFELEDPKLGLDDHEFEQKIAEAEDAEVDDPESPELGLDDSPFQDSVQDAEETDVADPEEPSLGLDTSEFSENIGEAESLGKSFGSVIGEVFEGIKGALVATGVVAAVAGVVSSLKEGVELVKNTGDAIHKQSAFLGLTTKAYQELDYALTLSGSSITDMTRSMRSFQQMAGGDITDKQAEAFEKLGIKAEAATDAQDLMYQSLYALADYSGQDRDIIAKALFGNNYTKLTRLLEAGSEGIKQMQEEAEGLGLVMTDEEIQNAADYMDATTRLEKAVESLKMSFVAEIIPFLTSATNELAKFVALFNWRTGDKSIGDVFNDIDKEGASALVSIEANEAGAKSLADQLIAMGDASKLTVEKQAEWKGIAEELISTIPGLTDVINLDTLSIEGGTEALQKNIEEWANLARQRALNNIIEKKEQALIEANEELINKRIAARKKEQEVAEARVRAEHKFSDKMKEYGLGELDFDGDVDKQISDLMSSLADGGDQNEDILLGLGTALKELGESGTELAKAKAEVEQYDAELAAAKTDFEEWKTAATEMFGQSATDAQTATSEVTTLQSALDNLPSEKRITIIQEYEEAHSHAIGSAYIPYDNYPALLHRGERILTATEARQDSGSVDISAMEDRIVAAIRAGMENATVRSYLNGQDITDEVNRNNTRTLKARRFNA